MKSMSGKGMQNQQYLTIIRDLQSGAVIHVRDGKGIPSLAGALKKLKKSKLRIVTMDMANAYYSWISENFSNANIVFDHFHVIKLMNDKLDLVCRRITAKMDDLQLDGIVTCWTFRHICNAKMESFNNKIRWLIKQPYGFRDREYNKIENLSITGNFKREIYMNICHKPSKR